MGKVRKPKKGYTSVPLKEAENFAQELAQNLSGGEVFGLVGELGAGKTTFVQMLAQRLGVTRRVSSPTFSIVASFKAKLPSTGKEITLHHLDVYRLSHPNEFLQLGIHELLGSEDTVVCIEWADSVQDLLPKHTKYIHLSN